MRRCASKDAGPKGGGMGGPTSIGKGTSVSENAGPRRGDGLGVLHRLEKGTSANKDARSRRRVDCEIPHRLGRRTEHSL